MSTAAASGGCVSDDFVTLKVLVASDAGPEREVLRRAASQASVPVVLTEVDDIGSAAPACEHITRDAPDVVVVDSRMPHDARKTVIDAARALPVHPLVIVLGHGEARALDIVAEAIAADGVVTAPIEPDRALVLLDGCVRARFTNRVLIVDDSSTVRSVVRKVLQSSRFQLESHEANDGSVAVERAQSEHFDIVFLDCHMPGLDGFSTLSELQRIRPAIKVVMMTASTDSSTVDRAKEAGAHHLLMKPFYAKDIDAVLKRVFGLGAPEAA
jgi:CheY-like chemotaxis protein